MDAVCVARLTVLVCVVHVAAGTRAGHRGPEPPVAGGGEASQGGRPRRQGHRDQQARHPAPARLAQVLLQNAPAEVGSPFQSLCFDS